VLVSVEASVSGVRGATYWIALAEINACFLKSGSGWAWEVQAVFFGLYEIHDFWDDC
jgi:hypothetical protein